MRAARFAGAGSARRYTRSSRTGVDFVKFGSRTTIRLRAVVVPLYLPRVRAGIAGGATFTAVFPLVTRGGNTISGGRQIIIGGAITSTSVVLVLVGRVGRVTQRIGAVGRGTRYFAGYTAGSGRFNRAGQRRTRARPIRPIIPRIIGRAGGRGVVAATAGARLRTASTRRAHTASAIFRAGYITRRFL